MQKNVMDGLLSEIERVQELLKQYEELPNGAGVFGSLIMRQKIKMAKDSISSGDVVDMLVQYLSLKNCTG